jgi:hypothetical protein
MPNPPDRVDFYDLSPYTTGPERATAISNLEATFYNTYGVYPNLVAIDSIVNGVHIGWYPQGS